MGFFEDLGNAAASVGNAAASVVSTVGDVAEAAVETVTTVAEEIVDGVSDTAQDVVNTVTGEVAANGGPILGGIANVVGGVIVGGIEGFQELAGDVLHIVRDVGGIVGSLLRLDVPRLLEEFANLGIDLVDFGLDFVRHGTGGFIVSAVAENFQREDLRAFVEDLIRTELEDDPELEEILKGLKISGGSWGLNFPANSRVMMFDTGTEGVADTVRQMHTDGVIDLFALANLLSFDSFSFNRPRTLVRVMDFGGSPRLFPVNRFDISSFLDGTDVRLQIFACTPKAQDEALRNAKKKFKKMGVKLNWNVYMDVPTLNRMPKHEITTRGEYRLDIITGGNQAAYFQSSGIKDPVAGECPVEALAAFHYALNSEGRESFGRVCGRDIAEGDDVSDCATPGRTDGCCITVDRVTKEGTKGSGVIHRDSFPPYFSKHVLAHEVGHYFGLCHFGHNGVQNIMFSAEFNNILDWGLLEYYLHSEPEFSYDDAKNVWRFIVNQMRDCLVNS